MEADGQDEIKLIEWIGPTTPMVLHQSKIIKPTVLNLNFYDLSYTTGKGANEKTILHKVSGTFKSGQLIAILGPSGAGKTSLMNILSGVKNIGVKGRVEINGSERNFKTFRKQSAYITQQDHLLQDLTIDEYMTAASHLKLGNGVSDAEKKSTIEHVMKLLGLANSRKTRISRLSGGECKRLAIGLEIIDNPSVLFLDEPTSGLDSSSTLQCVALLGEIARSGRTVVTTIHQPSSRLLRYFDHLYIVAGGFCMYQGPVRYLVPYFQSMNLNCPSYHNPVDFAMDVACGQYGAVLADFVSGVQNGRLNFHQDSTEQDSTEQDSTEQDSTEQDSTEQDSTEQDSSSSTHKTGKEDIELRYELATVTIPEDHSKKQLKQQCDYAAPFHTQVVVLLDRTWRIICREKMLTTLRFTAHVLVGILVGILFWFVGNDADAIISNTGMLFFNQLFILFTSLTPTVITFPLERKVLVREHLNHWYSLKAYYLAKTLADIPFQIIFPTVYLVIVYLMTNQPLSVDRFSRLLVITICSSLVGQGIGLLFGAALNIKAAVFLALCCLMPFMMFSGLNANYDSIPCYLKWLTYFSFFRYGFEGSMLSVYGFSRPFLDCSQFYCQFRNPQRFLEEFNMEQNSYYWSVIGLLVFFLVVRVAGYFVLRFKLKNML